jgi:hypothetical protein
VGRVKEAIFAGGFLQKNLSEEGPILEKQRSRHFSFWSENQKWRDMIARIQGLIPCSIKRDYQQKLRLNERSSKDWRERGNGIEFRPFQATNE